ncbi:MAG: DUF4230 domain-containing protein [Chitinophagaceae bacterium]|nr:DUF4230 domain-containing protein [Chitinophagaceae bacterium]
MSWKSIFIGIVILFVIGFLIKMRYGQAYAQTSSGLIMLLAGLVLGGLIFYLIGQKSWFGKSDSTREVSHSVVNSIEKVFKIVSAEGHFSEIYDYSQTTQVLSFIPSTKKALVIINAKVLMGFDFKKVKWEADETNNTLKIIYFPEPEILSIEPDVKYYNIDNGLFNKFSPEDLTKLQATAKERLTETALKSNLPKIASEQAKTLLLELVKMNNWQLEGVQQKSIAAPSKVEINKN